MDIVLLSKLIQSIKPSVIYEFEFPNGTLETKSGIDWRGTFQSLNRQITNKDGQKLIDFFTTPIKEATEINKTKKNK